VRNAFEALLCWGGFPEPYLARNARALRLWHHERRHLIVREDLRDLSRIQLLSHVEELVELLVDRSGGILSYNSLREDLQVALDSVRLWVGYLERLYFIYRVRPYAGRIARALRREPKLYLWDWSEVADADARFENLVASHLLKWSHFSQDWGHAALDLHFVRDKEKREVDFLVTRDKKPWLLIEAKLSNREPGPALHYFAEKLGVRHKFLVVANLTEPGTAAGVHVLDAPTFLASLPI
jgi:predicted AAA+ superfamily ATPase